MNNTAYDKAYKPSKPFHEYFTNYVENTNEPYKELKLVRLDYCLQSLEQIEKEVEK